MYGMRWGSDPRQTDHHPAVLAAAAVQAYARPSLWAQVRDPALRASLTPDHQPLCKRQVVSGTYYRAIQAPNAELISDAIAEVTPTGIRTADSTHRTPTSSCWPPGSAQ